MDDASSRGYLLIIRTNLFNFFNNILFTIGVALLALGRVNDAVLSVGPGLLNALISRTRSCGPNASSTVCGCCAVPGPGHPRGRRSRGTGRGSGPW